MQSTIEYNIVERGGVSKNPRVGERLTTQQQQQQEHPQNTPATAGGFLSIYAGVIFLFPKA